MIWIDGLISALQDNLKRRYEPNTHSKISNKEKEENWKWDMSQETCSGIVNPDGKLSKRYFKTFCLRTEI